jgi:hypothetical protein
MARIVSYTRQSTYTRTLTRVGVGSSATFTRDTHTSSRSFTAYYSGATSTRISSYAGYRTDPREERYVGNYTRDFTGNFIGNYSRFFAGNYSREYLGNYTGTYTRSYLGNFIGNYTRDFLGNYTGTYSSDYIGNYIADYTRNYTRTSTYTRTISGGSGSGPTYVASGSDAEYGLVVYGPDGVTEIINPQTKLFNLAHLSSQNIAGNGSVSLTIKDVSDPSKVIYSTTARSDFISFSTSGDTLTITNSSSTSVTIKVTAVRIS